MSGAYSGQRTEIFAASGRKRPQGAYAKLANVGKAQRVFIARMFAIHAHADARHSVISGKSGVSAQINKLGRFTPAGIVFF